MSPTVKSVRIKVETEESDKAGFYAGQWLDLFISGIKITGGFSMTSSPQEFQESRVLDLAVKYSDHPPARWVHNDVSLRCFMLNYRSMF